MKSQKRRFFKNKLVELAMEGDVVAVLLGGLVTFVLREQESNFTLLGESYIHGVMKGEAIEGENVALEMLGIV